MSENTLPEAPGSDDAPAEKRARKRVTKPQTAEAGAPAPEAATQAPQPSQAPPPQAPQAGATSGPVRPLLQRCAVADLGHPMPLYGH